MSVAFDPQIEESCPSCGSLEPCYSLIPIVGDEPDGMCDKCRPTPPPPLFNPYGWIGTGFTI